MRIWHQGFVELERVPLYARSLTAHVTAVVPDGTTVDLHGLAPGSYPPGGTAADVARDPARAASGVAQIVANVRRAERDGYDAAAITIVQDLGLREARAAVGMPVAGYGEAAMREAAERSRRFAVVAFDRGIALAITREIGVLGMSAWSLPVELVETDYASVVEAFALPGPLATAFAAAARRAIARGAQVIIPGQTIMAEALWSHGLRDIDGTPIVDALAVTLAAAERMVRARRNA